MNSNKDWIDFAENCVLIWQQNKYPLTLIEECRVDFFNSVKNHILEYVIPQYGENDTLSNMTSEDAINACVYSIKKYKARFQKNQRPYNDGRDCVKRAHYAQLLCKYKESGCFTEEDTREVWLSFLDYKKIGEKL